MKYDKNYFKTINYTDYLFRRDRYLQLAKEIHTLVGDKLRLIDKKSKIMDYGCAVGFLMEGFKQLKYHRIYGYDISEWAVKQAESKSLHILKSLNKRTFNMIICLDVLEHMTDRQIHKVFKNYESDIIIVRIPCSSDGKKFILDISDRDTTHINHKTKDGWIKMIHKFGYKTILPLNLFTIYDTPGVMCAIGLKSRAYF